MKFLVSAVEKTQARIYRLLHGFHCEKFTKFVDNETNALVCEIAHDKYHHGPSAAFVEIRI